MFRKISQEITAEDVKAIKHHAPRRDPADLAGMGLVSFNDRSDDTAFDHLFKGDDLPSKRGRSTPRLA
jgi:hypothetical protein